MDALYKVLRGIAKAVGEPQPDVDTDHGRWHLYETAIQSATALELVRQAVALEVDKALATSVVLRMLELVPEERQADWIDQFDPGNREYSERRAREIRILRRAREGALPADEIAAKIDSWTDWLQLRLADALSDRASLELLLSAGRTKRIQRTAEVRLRSLSG